MPFPIDESTIQVFNRLDQLHVRSKLLGEWTPELQEEQDLLLYQLDPESLDIEIDREIDELVVDHALNSIVRHERQRNRPTCRT